MKKLELFDKNGKQLDVSDVVNMLLPSYDDAEIELCQLRHDTFFDDGSEESALFGYGFRSCYLWLKDSIGNK